MDRASKQYSKFADQYEYVLGNIYSLAGDTIDTYFEGLPAGAKLVDIGCGPGFEAKVAAACGLQVTGYDACPEMLARFRAHVPNGIAVQGTIEKLPFMDQSFQALFSSCVLLHVNREEGLAALREFYRVLANGAPALLVTTLSRGEEDLHSRPALTAVGVDKLYFYHWERADLIASLKTAGFAVGEIQVRELVPGRPALAFFNLKKENQKQGETI